MRKKPREKRLRLFHRGNTQCPICLAPFTEKDVEESSGRATLEHVPPKALKLASRTICITCGNCNNRAGKGMEQAFAEAMKPQKVHMWIGGVLHSGRLSHIEGNTTVVEIPTLRVPPNELVGLTNRETKIHFRGNANLHYTSVSLLKAAYLSVFALLGVRGYRYAEGQAICQIREQIMNPEQEIIQRFAFRGTSDRKGNLIFLNREVRPCWGVKMGEWIVLLPRSDDTSFYKDAEIPTTDRSRQFRDLDVLRPSAFGETSVFSYSFDDGPSLRDRFGGDPFGTELTLEHNGKLENFVVADHGERDITLLPYLDPS